MPISTLARIASQKLDIAQDNYHYDNMRRIVYGESKNPPPPPDFLITGSIAVCDKIQAATFSHDLDVNIGGGSGESIIDMGYDRKDMLDKMCIRLRIIDTNKNMVIPGTNTENCIVTKKVSKQSNSGIFVFNSGWGHVSGITGSFGVDSTTLLLIDLSILEIIGKIFGVPLDLIYNQEVAMDESDLEDISENFRFLNRKQKVMILQHMMNVYYDTNIKIDGYYGRKTWVPVRHMLIENKTLKEFETADEAFHAAFDTALKMRNKSM